MIETKNGASQLGDLFIILALIGVAVWWHKDASAPIDDTPRPTRFPEGQARPKPIVFTEKDRDLMIRTVIGEAEHEPRTGKIAVAWVILNRLKNSYGWKTISHVVLANGRTPNGKRVWQFEPWMSRSKKLLQIPRTSKRYKRVAIVVDQVLAGHVADPTRPHCRDGAFYFLNEKTVRRRRQNRKTKLPAFAENRDGLRIGNHTFYCRMS